MKLRLCLLLLAFGCQTEETPDIPEPQQPTTGGRIVALGDVHGDLGAARKALRLAGAIDRDDQWIGGDLRVVQVGDQLDRGDEERAILDLFERLRADARLAGGEFHPMLGNHETMNVELDLRYVTVGGYADFRDVEHEVDDELGEFPEAERGRVAAFRPGGVYARLLSEHSVVLTLDDTVFVHGGVLPWHVDYGVPRLNREVSDWMRGEGEEPSDIIGGDGPLWVRDYSDDDIDPDCAALETVLEAMGAKRMVVAHSVQDAINGACDDRVWRVDVGLADYYGGDRQVLEIMGDVVSVITP
jgi:hypothetical protein